MRQTGGSERLLVLSSFPDCSPSLPASTAERPPHQFPADRQPLVGWPPLLPCPQGHWPLLPFLCPSAFWSPRPRPPPPVLSGALPRPTLACLVPAVATQQVWSEQACCRLEVLTRPHLHPAGVPQPVARAGAVPAAGGDAQLGAPPPLTRCWPTWGGAGPPPAPPPPWRWPCRFGWLLTFLLPLFYI